MGTNGSSRFPPEVFRSFDERFTAKCDADHNANRGGPTQCEFWVGLCGAYPSHRWRFVLVASATAFATLGFAKLPQPDAAHGKADTLSRTHQALEPLRVSAVVGESDGSRHMAGLDLADQVVGEVLDRPLSVGRIHAHAPAPLKLGWAGRRLRPGCYSSRCFGRYLFSAPRRTHHGDRFVMI